MQDIFENAKRVANSAVERAAWEADRLRRSTARQHEIELTQRERTALMDQVAGIVLDMARRGQLTQEPLKTLATRLSAIEDEVKRGQAEIQAIRSETFVPGTISVNFTRPSAEDTYACPTCGQQTRRNAAFCSACGARLH